MRANSRAAKTVRIQSAGVLTFLLGALLAASSAVSTPSALASDDCQNAAYRTGASAGLPECRAYEKVTPLDKGPEGVLFGIRSTTDGAAVAYTAFVGTADLGGLVFYNPSLVSRRSDDGWSTVSLAPTPLDPNPIQSGAWMTSDFSDDLRTSFSMNRGQYVADDQNGQLGTDVYARTLGEPVQLLSPGLTSPNTDSQSVLYAGRSDDSRRVVLESIRVMETGVPPRQLYLWENGSVRVISQLPDGSYSSRARIGGANTTLSATGSPQEPRAVADDAKTVFFSGNGQLYAWRDGQSTVQVSLSQRSGAVGDPAPSGATFQSASEDGSLVLFTSSDQLTDDATAGGGLYRYDLVDESLTFLSSGAPDASGAQVQGTVRVSADGRYVYFVANAQLVPGEGVVGQPNLYLAADGAVRYVGTLDPADGLEVWNRNGTQEGWHRARLSANGHQLLFQSNAAVGGSSSGGHQQMYLYDADGNGGMGRLYCVSCRPNGDSNEAGASLIPEGPGTFETSRGFQQPSAITADGDRVFFNSADALVPKDSNGLQDVYVWDRPTQQIRLLSDGTSPRPSSVVDNSSDGRDVFILTRSALTPDDVDGGQSDIYDARVGGGFPLPPKPQECEAGTCQGPPTDAPADESIGSIGLAGGHGDAVAPRVRVKQVRARPGAVARVRVRVSGAGRISVSGPRIRNVAKSVDEARAYVLRVKLNRKAMRSLRRSRRTKASTQVTYRAKGGVSASKTVDLTYAKANKRGGNASRRGGHR